MMTLYLNKNSIFISLIVFCSTIFANCHPQPSTKKSQYLIGYGSLINKASKDRTVPNTDPNLPILLSGYKRGWYEKGCKISSIPSTVYLGIQKHSGEIINAVIFKMNNANDLLKYDSREHGYCRVPVKPSKIKLLINKKIQESQFWVYLPKQSHISQASKQCPLVQSYIDLFIGGCLSIEKKYQLPGFAKQCITSTKQWSKHWVNDRIFPRRAFAKNPQASNIDNLLYQTVPNQFKHRYIE